MKAVGETVAAATAGTPLDGIPMSAAVAPAVRFGDERRPEAATQVRLAEFDGPLGLLLSLIEARQLDVLTVSLGALADAYLEALAGLEADRLGNVSAFVTVASQLILIKSRAMLPRRPESDAAGAMLDEGPDPEAQLRARLLLYRAYRDAGVRLGDEAARGSRLYRREPGVARAAGLAGARPTTTRPLDRGLLPAALGRLVELAPPPAMPSEIVVRTITITDRAAMIRSALIDAPIVVLQDLLAGVRDRVVIAVTFLAMLELMKRREIVVEQAEPWGPIIARRLVPADGEAAPVEDEEIDESLESFA